jgi:hypothetical protein
VAWGKEIRVSDVVGWMGLDWRAMDGADLQGSALCSPVVQGWNRAGGADAGSSLRRIRV